MVSNEPYTFSIALLESKHRSCLFMICQYGPLQKIVRLALSRELLSSSLSLFSWVTVAPLWPSLPHLSPCQDSSFIYRKAFTQINTATQQLPCTHTHSPHTRGRTRVHFVHQHAPQILAYDQSKTKHGCSGLACLFDSCLSFCRLFSLNTPSSFFIHLIFDCFLSILNILSVYPLESSGLSWRRWSEELEGKQMIGDRPSPAHCLCLPPASRWLINAFGFPRVAAAQAAWKVSPTKLPLPSMRKLGARSLAD